MRGNDPNLPSNVKIVEVDSGRGATHCEIWEWEDDYLGGEYAGTVERMRGGSLGAAIRDCVELGYKRIVVRPLPAWCGGVHPVDTPIIYPEGVVKFPPPDDVIR